VELSDSRNEEREHSGDVRVGERGGTAKDHRRRHFREDLLRALFDRAPTEISRPPPLAVLRRVLGLKRGQIAGGLEFTSQIRATSAWHEAWYAPLSVASRLVRSPRPRRAPQRIGQRIDGRWTLQSLVGEGGNAAVYCARDEAGGPDVAVKLIHPAL